MKKLFNFRKPAAIEPTIVPREQHIITRKNISANALKVMYRLQDAGFSAYLVGGSVRDLLLDRHPKDFDVATNARPEQVKKLFRNCLLIGRRFRLAHVRFGHEIIEVATFRAAPSLKFSKKHQTAEYGMLLRDNVYGTLAEDAVRRDFTINALYYNIADFSIVDYCGGFADLKDKTLRIIGDPRQRYHEDPVRLLRVIRFAGKLGFEIDPATRAPILELAPLLKHVPPARLFDEVLKLFHSGHACNILLLVRQYHLFEQLFPQLADCLTSEQSSATTAKIITLICQNTDARINEGKTVSAGFLFASLLWQPFQQAMAHYLQQGETLVNARHYASHQVISQQIRHITIPRRFSLMIREIWDLQYYFEKLNAKYINRTVNHPRFRAAYDFLLIRAQTHKDIQATAQWWQKFYEADTNERQQLLTSIPKTNKRRRKRKKTA